MPESCAFQVTNEVVLKEAKDQEAISASWTVPRTIIHNSSLDLFELGCLALVSNDITYKLLPARLSNRVSA